MNAWPSAIDLALSSGVANVFPASMSAADGVHIGAVRLDEVDGVALDPGGSGSIPSGLCAFT